MINILETPAQIHFLLYNLQNTCYSWTTKEETIQISLTEWLARKSWFGRNNHNFQYVNFIPRKLMFENEWQRFRVQSDLIFMLQRALHAPIKNRKEFVVEKCFLQLKHQFIFSSSSALQLVVVVTISQHSPNSSSK